MALVAAVGLLAGCVTRTYRDFKTEDLKSGEAVAIGRVRVRFNGQFYTKECSVCIAPVSRDDE